MPIDSQRFKRLVLGLQPSAPDRSVQLAAELAGLLDVELLGLFLQDTSLLDVAGVPFAREFRSLGGGWHPIDVERLTHDLDLAARSIERVFTDATKHLAIRCQFEVLRGRTADTITAMSRVGDIVMIVEPASAAERATQQFSWLVDAAFRSAAAVMFVPTGIAQTRGPIAAIAAGPDDPSIHAAASIAIAAKEDLVIIEARESFADAPSMRTLASDTGLVITHVAARDILRSDLTPFFSTLPPVYERLIVMTRGTIEHEAALAIASSRRVPVLIIKPGARRDDVPQD